MDDANNDLQFGAPFRSPGERRPEAVTRLVSFPVRVVALERLDQCAAERGLSRSAAIRESIHNWILASADGGPED